MEDKRILKTKKNLKNSLVALLSEKPFEQITVKELCEVAQTSRITFYTHYNDKYDLANDIFEDMVKIATDDFHFLQKENNAGGDPILSYCNMFDCILNVYYNHNLFFSHTGPGESPYLNNLLYQYVSSYIRHRADREKNRINSKYSSQQTTALLYYALWGFLSESYNAGRPQEEIRRQTKEVLKSLLRSDIFVLR